MKIFIRRHYRQGRIVRGYVRRHNYLATVKGRPEFKREVEQYKVAFGGPLPVNVRETEYVQEGTSGLTSRHRTGMNVEIATSIPGWRGILAHEAYHVSRRQKKIPYSGLAEERLARKAGREQDLIYATTPLVYPPNVKRKIPKSIRSTVTDAPLSPDEF